MSNSLEMQVKGMTRRVTLYKKLSDGGFNARVRQTGTGNSVRGIAKQNKLGHWRFAATNPSNLY